MTVAGIHHLAIKVRDLVLAERFYCGVLGLKVARRWPAATGAGERSLWLDLGDGTGTFAAIEVVTGGEAAVQADAGADASGGPTGEAAGHHLLALRIAREDRAAWEARLAGAGVTVTHRSNYTIYFADPEGNLLGLSHYPQPAS